MSSFFISTPIYYVNDKPHAGTAYTTVLADILNRYHHFFEQPSFFLTGLDEHGQKCQQTAELKKQKPQELCDQMAQVFQKTWQALDIQYSRFYRTTSPDHKKKVQQALQKLFDSHFIYESSYEGWYSVSEEIFYKEKDLINGRSPEGKEVIKIKEKNYFFKMSQFKDRLVQHLKQNPHFIYPQERQNEVLGFLNKGLDDLCISRPKKRLQWGIELPFDSHYVAYVWVDALLNYVFGAGLNLDSSDSSSASFHSWWSESHHLIGKDILITHAVYWPCLLMALGLPLPKRILSHGWLLNKEQEKMSKSKGGVLDPMELLNELSPSALRYFFMKGVRFGQDAPISRNLILKEYNDDLVNNLGNLLQRTTVLLEKFFDGKTPQPPPQTHPIQIQAQKTCGQVKTLILNFSLNQAVFAVVELLNTVNKFLEKEEPWKQAQSHLKQAGFTLYTALEALRVSAGLLQPVIPQASREILKRMGLSFQTWDKTRSLQVLAAGQAVKKGPPLFPRPQK